MAAKRKPLADQLRAAIERCGTTRYRIALDTGFTQSELSRFVNGLAGLPVAKMERLADYLGLEIVLQPKAGKPAKRTKGT